MQGFPTKYANVDIVTIRENTEGEYTGIEHEVGGVQTWPLCYYASDVPFLVLLFQVIPGVVENLKVRIYIDRYALLAVLLSRLVFFPPWCRSSLALPLRASPSTPSSTPLRTTGA